MTRLAEEWFNLVSDTDPLTMLVVEVVEALVEVGLPLHDCAGAGSAGGICQLRSRRPAAFWPVGAATTG